MSKRSVIAALALNALVSGCSYSKPPQSGFYCIDVPPGRAGDVDAFIEDTAARLHFKVSKGAFPFEADNVHRAYEVYGRGVSLMISTSMHSGKPDQFDNRPTKANPHRWSMQAVKTGWWQREAFDRALSAAITSAKSHGFTVTKASVGEACSTEEVVVSGSATPPA
ncbi:MAG TPA: hypothetical protein VJM13_08115 [Sphingopyxis sp.]|nr:hypothetical protein [Sphingopyxis sp.]